MNEKITKLFMPKKVIRYENMSALELRLIRKWEYIKSILQNLCCFLVGFIMCQIAVVGVYQEEGVDSLLEMIGPEPGFIEGMSITIIIMVLGVVLLDYLPVPAEKIKKRYTRVINYDS